MSPFFIALTLTDVLLLTLLVALPVRVAWWAKLIAIVVVLGFNFVAWQSTGSGTGWAKPGPFPKDAQFVSCLVIEPDIATGNVGAIYVWAIPLDSHHGVLSYRPSGFEPRAYVVGYDRSLHKACEDAKKKTAQGSTVALRKGKGHPGQGRTGGGKWVDYVLPPPNQPQKAH